MAKLLSRLSLIIFGIVMSLVILEIAFRLLYPTPAPQLVNQALQLHDTYGLAFTPNAAGWNTSLRGEYNVYVKINSKGLRGSEHDYTHPSNTYRILVLGDSFTAALQVQEDEVFTSLLETRLNQQYPGTTFEVINAGVVGYGTTNELAYFTHEGYKYNPDLVLLAFFAGNDIFDNINPPHYRLESGRLIPIEAEYDPDVGMPPWAKAGTPFRNLRNYLYRHSRVYSVTLEILVVSLMQRIPGLANRLGSLGLVEITRPIGNVGNIYAYLHPSEEAWQMTEALLLKLNQEVQRHGSRLVVAILPDETEVNPARWEKLFGEHPALFKDNPSTQRPSQRLAEFLEQHAIPTIPLQPALATYQRKTKRPLYYKIDGHWTPEGHYAAFQAIYRYLPPVNSRSGRSPTAPAPFS